jgi:hypothetical protein
MWTFIGDLEEARDARLLKAKRPAGKDSGQKMKAARNFTPVS